jgi:post-segregation antitoxin (ccd killing protein)
MNRRAHVSPPPKKRRTTLTLPADSLTEAQRIAHTRKVNLSTVIAEALSEGLRLQTAAERREEVLEGYKKAFAGFSDEEMSMLDGVILEPAIRH